MRTHHSPTGPRLAALVGFAIAPAGLANLFDLLPAVEAGAPAVEAGAPAAEAVTPAAAVLPAIEWATVGDPGNPPDVTGHGRVTNVFQISRHEITVGQYAAFLNAAAARDPHGLWNAGQKIDRQGEPGAFRYAARQGHDREPVMQVSFLDAMRFANWLHHAAAPPGGEPPSTETGGYEIAAGGGLAARSPGARAWIPSEDEWYKAAYHQPHPAGGPPNHYWRYPTRSDAPPVLGIPGDTAAHRANFLADVTPQPNGGILRGFADVMPVGSFPGSASHHGTLDQAGNAWEWVEATVFDSQRVIRGGSMCGSHEKLLATVRTSASPGRRYGDTGFRVARPVPAEAPSAGEEAAP